VAKTNKKYHMNRTAFLLASAIAVISSCNEADTSKTPEATDSSQVKTGTENNKYLSQPLPVATPGIEYLYGRSVSTCF
jgi:hypothetical protein